MPTYYDYDTQTSTYAAGLQYSGLSGITVSGSPVSSWFIGLHLNQVTSPTYTTPMQQQSVVPIYDMRGGLAYGGNVVGAQGSEFAKVTLAGWIDAPLVSTTETGSGLFSLYSGEDAKVPAVQVNSIPVHWVDVLAMFFEGRFNGQRHDPDYYRDPYGRQYNKPRMTDFTATDVAGAPTRANFTMTLMLSTNSA